MVKKGKPSSTVGAPGRQADERVYILRATDTPSVWAAPENHGSCYKLWACMAASVRRLDGFGFWHPKRIHGTVIPVKADAPHSH